MNQSRMLSKFVKRVNVDRTMARSHSRLNSFIKSKLMSADDVAQRLPEQLTLGASGFTPAGYPKVIPAAFAKRIENSSDKNRFSINLYTGASTGDELDGVLARTGRMKLRIPYQSHPDLRRLINQGKMNFIDMHLSHVGRYIREGIFPPIDVAIVEACDVTADGRIYLTNSSGMSGTYLSMAKDIYIELNEAHPLEMKGLHDIYLPELHSGRPIQIDYVDDRIGESTEDQQRKVSLNHVSFRRFKARPMFESIRRKSKESFELNCSILQKVNNMSARISSERFHL